MPKQQRYSKSIELSKLHINLIITASFKFLDVSLLGRSADRLHSLLIIDFHCTKLYRILGDHLALDEVSSSCLINLKFLTNNIETHQFRESYQVKILDKYQ